MRGAWRDYDRCYLIAEIGGNHEGDAARARELAAMAAAAGADAVKFQSYTADALVNCRLAPGRHAHFSRLQLTPDDWRELSTVVAELGCDFMTSLWDPSQLQYLVELVDAWKVGSGDLTHWDLITQLLDTGKPVVLSTAMADLDLVTATMSCVGEAPVKEGRLGLLQCTAMYDDPTSSQTELAVMERYKTAFPGVTVGFSNHHKGLDACLVAIARGAEILEVHFTDDKQRASHRDHRLSLVSQELTELRRFAAKVPRLIGTGDKRPEEVERDHTRTFRRAVYPKRDVAAGHQITREDLVLLRPEVGIAAHRLHEVVGRTARRALSALQPLAAEDLA